MLARFFNRSCLVRGLLSAAVVGGCLWPARSAAADDGDALVIVNGHPISRQKVVKLLMETHGLRMMQQLILLELAKQESHRRGARVTQADVDAQFRAALSEIAPEVDARGVTLTEEGKREALEKFLQLRCLTMPEFMLAMERNAHLRKVVETDFQVDEATLREEFARTHGEKVEVRHIQIDAQDTPRLHEVLDALSRANADFAEIARRFSVSPETASGGGLMAPFTFSDETIPPALREVAFALRPGEVSSATLTGRFVHILRLERRIPPADVRFEDVRAEVEHRLRERVIRQKMNDLITKLFRGASIRVLDRALRREFDALLEDLASEQGALP